MQRHSNVCILAFLALLRHCSVYYCFSVGGELAELAKKVASGSKFVKFKSDEKTWGVTGVNDERLTLHSFGEYKNHTRLEAEAKLTAYLCGFSEPRYAGGGDSFAIATAVAAPGTGKTRLLDDTVRGLIAADKSGDVLFDPSDKLLLAITFNGATTRACVHNVASRCVLEFFCCQPVIDDATLNKGADANTVLDAIDAELSRLVRGPVATVEQDVLTALEALFFNARGSSLGRSVLLVDEISKATNEGDVYRSVVEWVDACGVRVAGRSGFHSRRGAVFTGLSVQTPWAHENASGRSVVRLALGLFDVWDPQLQDAILLDMRKRPKWANVTILPAAIWSLLASAGGRPRDMEDILELMSQTGELIDKVNHDVLLPLLRSPILGTEHVVFRRYLLPSLLNVQFVVHDGTNPTQFGRDVTSRALCNSDLLATTGSNAPSVSLRFYECLDGPLKEVFSRLVRATTFYELSGAGKDFEKVWVLLLQTHLLLQHRVRLGSDFDKFWPQSPDGVRIGGRRSPTGDSLQMFACGIARELALFEEPDKGRAYEAPESTICREIHFDVTEPPPVMLWQNLWVADVRFGDGADVSALVALREVEWKSPALVYFTQKNHDAIDFLLLVGEMGGSGATEPHVYMFQCKAQTRDSVAAAGLQEIVDKLDAKLDKLFSRAFKGNVLRVAGINSKKQVTLCVAALQIGDDFTFAPGEAKSKKKKLITPPFNVVLFDAASFRGVGGKVLDTTRFMRFIDDKLA
jgi:hypothetical protein